MGNFFDQFDGGDGVEDAGNFFDKFDESSTDQPAAEGITDTLWEGTKSAGRAIGATVDAYTGDNQGIVDKAAAQQAAPKDPRVEKFYQDFAQRTEALGEDPGVLDTIGEGLGAVWDNPAGAGLAMVEQLPNAVPTLAGGYAGLKAGAAAGAVAGAPFAGVGAGPGAAIGGVLGGLAGMFLGNAAIETGHKAMGMADDGEVTDEERGQAIEEGAVKGAVITGVDAFTLGLGGKVAGTLNRTATTAVETATRKALLDRGVDVADEAAVLAAKSNPETFAAVRAAQENAIKATDTLKRRAAQGGTLFAMETVGEGVGEYLGEMAATGEGSVPDAVLESLLSAGQSGVETAWNMSRKSPNSAKWVQPTPSAENPNPAPVERPDPSAGPLSAAASLLPAPSIAGALPAPDQTLYGDGLGNVSPNGPARDVDREYRPVPGRDQQVRDFGPGMDQQYQQGAAPGIEGQLIRASRQRQAPAGREPQTFDAVESPRLPAPAPRIADGRQDAVIVDAAGNAVPGKLPGQQPEDYVQGGRGMDQQAPTRTFSNVLAAKNAISKSPNPAQLEVVPVGPKQFEIRSKRAVPTKGARKTVDREKDSVVQAIARLGGIKTEWRQDTTGEAKGNRIVPGVGALWTDKTGTSIDDMASLLQQNGYVPAGEMEKDGGVSWLQAAISDELSGRKTHLAPGSKRQEEETQQLIAQREADIAAQQEAAGDFDSAEVIVSDLLDDLDIMEIRAERARKFAEELDAIFEGGTNENSTSTASADNRPAEDARTENGAGGSAGAREPGPVQQPDARAESTDEVEAPSLELSSYTEQDLAAQAKLQAEAEAKAATEAKAAADKAQADRDRNDFTLTGSDRPSDVAAARGQNDMFAPPTRGERKTEQAQRNPVDYLREIVRQSNVPQTDAVGAARGAILNPDASAVERQALLEEVGATDAQSIAELDAALVKWWRRHFRARGEHKAKANADMAAFDQQRRDRDVEDTLELGRQAAADLDAQRTMVDAGSVADQLASMNVDDLSALIDSIAEQEAAPQTAKPKAQRSSKAKTASGKPRVRSTTSKAERTDTAKPDDVSRSAGEIAKSLGVNMSSAGMNALEGLTKLFGGPGRLNSGLSFDEETYAKAKPHFAAAMADIQAAGKDLRDFIRALLGQFGDGVKPYIMRYAQDLKQEQASGRTNQYLEPDRTANAEQGAGRDLRNDQPGEDGRRAEQLGEGQGGQRANDSTGVPGSGPAAGGERGDSQVDGAQSELAGRDAGSADAGRGGPDSTGGLYAGREADPAADRAIAQSVKAPAKANLKPSSKPGTLAEIKEQMPFLTDGQAEDVVFAEKRLSKPDGYGVLYTNGTGTGKTFTGLGIAARQAANGKTNILIVAPKQPIVDAWVKAGKGFFGLDIKPLESKQDNGGSGIVVTTFANLGDNNSLALREWDLVIADEAQYLSSDMAGSVTQALSGLRALTRRRGTSRNLVNMREADKVARMKALYASIESNKRDALESGSNHTYEQDQKDQAEADLIRAELDELYAQEEAANAAIPPEQKPRAVFLSATPFAYEKNVVWAQEFLFDWGTDDGSSQAYNAGGPYERFMIQHFGYRMRYNKLNEPDAKVDRGLMQRAFNSWLKREGALSGRALDSEYDYDRLFVTVDSPIGRRVDEALKWLRDMTATKDANGNELHASEEEREAYNTLHDRIAKGSFDYHARMYFLEAIKAREALPHIRAHLDAGRKVLVMHDFKKGGAVNPFRQSFAEEAEQAAYEVFRAEFPDLIRAFDVLPSPIDQLSRAFPDALVYNGSYSAKKRVAMQDAFNSDDDGSPRLMIAQGDAMREGVSIHDTTGKASRTMIHLGMPVKPTSAIQQEGRTYRTGQASNAMFRYFTIGTSWERSAFAGKIAARASAAENLAMGEQARGLKQAFIDAYENADLYEPGFAGEGTGGKAADRAAAAALTPWDMAKSFYFGTKKQGAGRSARGREGNDYFATPEPVGLKMVEWADIRGGESVLEPSGGHGAIARWFPDAAKVRVIEQSADLASRVALHVDGEVVHGNFEDHHIVNKYDAIVMNPPYGLGGAVAIPHLAKAAEHLRDGGRVVALIPTGPAADKKFDNWLYALDKNGKSQHPDLHLIADVTMPSVTFERAGTSAATRLVIIERVTGEQAEQLRPTRKADLTSIESIGELFDRLENMEMPARLKPVEEEAEQTAPAKSVKPAKLSYAEQAAAQVDKLVTDAPIIEHTVQKSGKVLRGVIVTDMTLAEAKEKLDKYAFPKNGGVFVRQEYIQRPGVNEDGARYTADTGSAPQMLREPTASEDGYETDLFGQSIPASNRKARTAKPAKPGLQRDVQPAAGVPADTPTPAGDYSVRTIIGSEVSRRLGTDRIKSAADLAQATQYLHRSAVERLDGIVTDKQGKPLAVVGGFKGAIDSASVYPATILGEAVRVPGAANIWFSHNHPSGNSELSNADRHLFTRLADVFEGSGIEPGGLIAVGRGEFSATDGSNGAIPAGGRIVSVPAIEREQIGEPLQQTITSPTEAMEIAAASYAAAKAPGILLLNSKHAVTGWAPIAKAMLDGPLRHTGQLNAIYRAISEGNPGAAILVHGGELDTALVGAHDAGNNIAAAIAKAEVRVLDVINVKTKRSRADRGEQIVGNTLYRLNPSKAKGLPLFSANGIAKKVMAATGLNATVVNTEADLPADLQAQIRRDKATGRVAGVYHNGTAYLVASNLRDTQHAISVMLHEAIGHGGVKSVLGERIGKVMAEIYRDMPAAMRKELERRYAGQMARMSEADARVMIAEEYVAHLAETDPRHSIINRLVALLRQFIRDTFGKSAALKWTRNDLVLLLAEARTAARNGGRGPGGAARMRETAAADALAALPEVDAADESAFVASLKGDAATRSFASALYKARGTESPFFKAWFGKSRMADKQGQPIAFVHRSYGERDTFSDADLGKNTGTPTATLGHFLARKDVSNVERYGPVVEQFYIRMEKPKVITQAQFEAMGDWSLAKVQTYRKTLMEQGHDGLYIQGLSWPVVFEGKNIKAKRNQGTFDATASTRYSLISDAADLFTRFGQRPADPNDPFAEENRRLREQDKSLWDKAKREFRRQFAPGGLLPDAVFGEKVKRDSEFQAVEFDVRHLARGLERAIKADFGAAIDDLPDDQMKRLADALAGKVDPSLPEGTKVAVVAMRQYIDSLSAEYIGILQQQVRDNLKGADAALIEKITGNIGSYVHRSYQAFDDPKWFQKVPTEVVNAARHYLAKGYMEQGDGKKEAYERAEVKVNEMLKTGTAYDSMESFIAEGKLGAKDLSVLIKRKSIAPEIRALLGEYSDPRLNFAKSATKMGRLIWNQRFLDRVREDGVGVFLFEGKDRPAGATVQIAGEASDAYAPLNGLWTFPDVAQAFKDSLGKEQMSDLYRTIVRLNGMVKYGKTVLSPTTAMRNWQSAMFFSLANGHFDLTQMKHSWAALREQVTQNATGDDLTYLRKLKQLGVVYDTPYAGEMMALLNDARMDELLSGKSGAGFKWLRKINEVAQGFYSFGDDFWKIIGFENEKASLIKAGIPADQAEQMAAERIRNTYPTYSMVGKGINWLRRFPLAGTFVSFPAEIIRTSVNMLQLTAADLKSDNPGLQAIGRKRVVGIAMVSAGFYALAAMTAAAFGVGDDEEEAIRDLAAPWQRNSTFLYTGRDADGKLRYFDMSFLDPYGYWKRPLTAMLRDQPWEKAAASGIGDMLSPFLGTDIAAGAIFEVLANKKGSGGQVYQEGAGAVDQTTAIADHLRKALQPGFVSNAERLLLAGQGARREGSGQPYDMRDEVVSLLGWRASTLDTQTALYYRSFEFTDGLRDASKVLSRTLRSSNAVTDADIRSARETAQGQYDQAFKEMGRLVSSARAAGMSNSQIMQTLRSSGVTGRNAMALIAGRVPPMNAATLQGQVKAVQQARMMQGSEHAQEIARRFAVARQL